MSETKTVTLLQVVGVAGEMKEPGTNVTLAAHMADRLVRLGKAADPKSDEAANAKKGRKK